MLSNAGQKQAKASIGLPPPPAPRFDRSVWLRIATGLLLSPSLLLVLVGGWPLQLACLMVCLLMTWELQQLWFVAPHYAGLRLVMFVAVGLLACSHMHLAWFPCPLQPLLAGTLLALLLSGMVLRIDVQQMGTEIAKATFVVLYTSSLLPLLVLLADHYVDGGCYALMTLMCIWSADTGAYFVGKLWGKHKLAPAISPGKTWEGLFGGLLWGWAMVEIWRQLAALSFSLGQGMCFAALACSFGLFGDLSESLLKRSVGAKDSSKLLPGHGGMLDRFDSVLFAVPCVYVVLVYGGYVSRL